MRRKSVLLGVGILVVLLGGGSASLAWLVCREPAFYHDVAVAPGEARAQRSKEFEASVMEIYNDIQGDQAWQHTFTEEQINSYFEEDFVRSGFDERMLPECISRPRVALGADRLRLAFRYGSGAWSTVVSIDLKMWLAARQPNAVALELEGLHAGSLPITAQSLLERVTEAARRNNVDVNWYRHPSSGNPVAVLRFQADRERPTVQLQWLDLQPGKLTIGGRSLEPSPIRAMLPPGALRPGADY